MKKLYVIGGPTAVGKTSAAISLAQALQTSIISADSRQCYREMKIGVARPDEAELAAVPHYFIASHSVTEGVSAADFEKLSLQWLEEIFGEKYNAVVCGGTGLYLKALCEGLDEMPKVPQEISEALQWAYEQKGISWLQEVLQAEDPLFAQTGEMQNPSRMLRALGFVRATGDSIVNFRTGKKKQRPFSIIRIALDLPRPVLYERINIRVQQMMEKGLLAEVKSLLPYRNLSPLQTVGYQEIFAYLDGKTDLHTAVTLIAQHTRNYAKRQLTWFRKDQAFHWLDANDENLTTKMLELGIRVKADHLDN